MTTRSVIFCLLAFGVVTFDHVHSAANASVSTPLGVIQGINVTTINGFLMQAFLGVPYAQSPPARFTRPSPLTTYPSNPYNANKLKADCARWGPDSKMMDPTTSEDCLYLRILVPANVTCCMPVMFWIQSGGFNDGGLSDYDDDALGDNFVAKGVIVVQVSHRQGPLGFFTTGTSDAMGNYGVWDSLEALKFVRKNIGFFGGDPNKITIMGYESGAVMAELLSLSPHAQHMYSSMILMDGSVFDPVILRNDNTNLQRSQQLATLVGCDNATLNLWNSGKRAQVVNCLKALPIAQVVSAIGREQIMQHEPGSVMCNYYWRPRYDGVDGVLPNFFEYLAEGRPRVPTMAGVMKRDWVAELMPFIFEGTSMFPPMFNATYNTQQYAQETCNNLLSEDIYDQNTLTELTLMCLNNFTKPTNSKDAYYWTHRAAHIATSYHVMAPIYKSASFMRTQNNGHVYIYSFDYDRSALNGDFWNATGAARFMDVALLENYYPTFDFDTNDETVMELWSDMLTNFAKFGNPTPSNYSKVNQPWLKYGYGENFMSIDVQFTMKSGFYTNDSMIWINSGALNEDRFIQD